MTLPEPDTHCWDDDEQKDVWSYSTPLVEQMLAERDAVLKMALKALEVISSGVCEAAHHTKKDQHDMGVLCPIEQRHDEAITAIRKVLEP